MDRELVAFDAEGRPDLPRLLRRHALTDPWRIRQARLPDLPGYYENDSSGTDKEANWLPAPKDL